MKKTILLISIFILAQIGFIQAQTQIQEEFAKNGEICFQFKVDSQKETDWFSKIVSIDDLQNGLVTAYANENEFIRFLKSGKDYKLLPHPNENFNPKMASFDDLKSSNAWDVYPTYDAYVAMMYQFETDYPAICDVYSIGQTVNGRELLVAEISDNINTDEDEPEFLYTSTMHGDETAGYIFMLRLIDSLLTNYGSVQRITDLVNSMEIYINPLANPDGTYNGGNSTVAGAKRTNGNNIDFNRNFPDPEDGPHPDGNAYQPETLAFMAFAENHHFVSSCNMHGGSEVCNYPWDTWYASTKLAADNDWWVHVCREYADTVHAHAPSGYMDGFDNGITHGATWYSIAGGRQDYMNYFQQCREFTLELSNTKLLPESQLNTYWGYNRRSFLNYMEQSLYGFRGIVTHANTGQPIKAEVYILNHELDSSWVYSSLPVGDYHRLVNAGIYDVRYSAPGYIADTVFNLNITNESTIIQNVQLEPFRLNLKVYLEGPYNGSDMNPSTNSGLPITQPYNISPWDYPGTESVASIPNANIVDWVLVELRDAIDAVSAIPSTRIDRQAAFLLDDGTVAGMDGFSNLSINQPIIESLFLVIYHRNHLGIMSARALTESGGTYVYDFTSPAGQAYGTDAQKNLGGNIYGMFAGDANVDKIIDDLDKSGSWMLETGLSGYLPSDLNLDGESNNLDKNDFWLPNWGKNGHVPE